MNLRVDLILDSERRSSSVINPKMLLRVASVVVPVVLAGLLTIQVLIVGQLGKELQGLKTSLDNAQPQQQKASELMTQFLAHKNILAEMDGWRSSRMAWSEQLEGLMRVVPDNIQLQRFSVSQTLQLSTADKPARSFSASLEGKAVTDDAEQSVRGLENALIHQPPFSPSTTNVLVPQYAADGSPSANRDDRVFQITCQYLQRTF